MMKLEKKPAEENICIVTLTKNSKLHAAKWLKDLDFQIDKFSSNNVNLNVHSLS